MAGAARQVRGERGSEADLAPLAREDWDLVVDNIGYKPEAAIAAVEAFSGKVGRFVFTSTASVYHAFSNSANPVLIESWPGSPAAGEVLASEKFPYGVLKWGCEEVYRKAFQRDRFPVVMLRYPMVVGPDDPTGRCQAYLWRLTQGGPLILPDGGRHPWRFLWHADAARAILEAAVAPGIVGEVFNVADLETTTLARWLRLCAEALGVALETVEIPIPWLDARDFPYEASPYASSAPFMLKVGKADRVLGWKSTPVKEWIRELCAWYREKVRVPPKNAVYWEREKELAALYG